EPRHRGRRQRRRRRRPRHRGVTAGMLIDDWMPVYDAVERHERAVASPGAMVYAALWRTDFAASGVVRWLLALRGLGKPRSLTLASLTESGFVKLGVQNPLPIWLGVGGTPQSFVRAGRLGLPLMVAIIGGETRRF